MSLSKLHCIIDCSGSMAEYGKPMLMVNLLRYIRQFTTDFDITITYFSWQEDISEVSWNKDSDVKLPEAEMSSNIAVLCSWGRNNPETTLLILTDGYFDLTAEQRQQLTLLENLFFIGVGGDANLVQLHTLSEHNYKADQIDQVLNTIKYSKRIMTPPTTRINRLNVLTEDENDDEW